MRNIFTKPASWFTALVNPDSSMRRLETEIAGKGEHELRQDCLRAVRSLTGVDLSREKAPPDLSHRITPFSAVSTLLSGDWDRLMLARETLKLDKEIETRRGRRSARERNMPRL